MTTPPERSVLITGCSSGIGLCVAQGLRTRGYRVFASARDPDDVALLEGQGFECWPLDLRDSGSIREAVRGVFEATGGTLYGLFNNGAYGQPGAVEDVSREALRLQFETNLFGTHELTTQVLPIMRRQGFGRIIQNSSVLGLVCMRFRGAYNASKFALEALTDTLRLELVGTGVHVCLIEPGPIASRFRANALEAFRKHVESAHSVHSDTYRSMEQRLAKEGNASAFTLPPEAVLKRVVRALESPRPRTRYYVTFPTYLFATLRHVLPTRVLDRILIRSG